jgi:DNA-binding GntR family transcriptional regulator
MLAAIRDRDVERADRLAHAHTRQFQQSFVDFLTHNYLAGTTLPPARD